MDLYKKIRLKPMLTKKYIKNRIEFCISKVDKNTGVTVSNYDTMHIDEKWVYVTFFEGETYWLTDEEDVTSSYVQTEAE